MKKNILSLTAIVACIALASCGGKKSAASVAKQWCDMNAKVTKAAEGPDKEAAREALHKWEKETEAKYANDKAFMEEVGKEVEKCEDASEGRK